ncbi:hypothetical protein TNIN_111901, partial [Trichonephila inaurata madagascariensis]
SFQWSPATPVVLVLSVPSSQKIRVSFNQDVLPFPNLTMDTLRLSQSEMGCVAGSGVPVPVGVDDLLINPSFSHNFKVTRETHSMSLALIPGALKRATEVLMRSHNKHKKKWRL